MKIFLSLMCVLMLSGCMITPMTVLKGASMAKTIGEQKIADKFLNRNLKQLCNWSTEGSVYRKWGDNPTKLKQYRALCDRR